MMKNTLLPKFEQTTSRFKNFATLFATTAAEKKETPISSHPALVDPRTIPVVSPRSPGRKNG